MMNCRFDPKIEIIRMDSNTKDEYSEDQFRSCFYKTYLNQTYKASKNEGLEGFYEIKIDSKPYSSLVPLRNQSIEMVSEEYSLLENEVLKLTTTMGKTFWDVGVMNSLRHDYYKLMYGHPFILLSACRSKISKGILVPTELGKKIFDIYKH